jgi:hypothetical protein
MVIFPSEFYRTRKIPDKRYSGQPWVAVPSQAKASVRTDGADGRANVFASNEKVGSAGDYPPRCFTRFRIGLQRFIVDALRDLELSDRLGRISRLVNVGRHHCNLRANSFAAFTFRMARRNKIR